jgi:formate hydrogenlyase subunit 3/multisubunit Na+/H+ antiporter MnhD subunit
MNAPLLWIGLPLAVALMLIFFNQRRTLTGWLAASVCLLLALLAATLQIGQPLRVGRDLWELKESFTLLGRAFVLPKSEQGFLTLIYSVGALWQISAVAILKGPQRLFAPLSLAILSLLVAARSVQPFLFAALLIEIAILLSLPLLTPPGQRVQQGVLRYLIFQTLALPFILSSGWVFGLIEANPARQELYQQAALLLGMGFALWLAIFPFYTWVPLLAGDSHPFHAGYLFSILPTIVLFYALDFLNAYAWLRDAPLLVQALRITGAIMVASGGLWAGFQRDLTRLFGYAVILETGFALLSLSLHSQAGLALFATAFLPRLLALWLGAFALSVLRLQNLPLDLDSLKGLLRRAPLIAIALLCAWFSLGGLPLLASFPIRQVLFEALAQQSLPTTLWAVLGSLGLLFTGLRALQLMTQQPNQPDPLPLPWPQSFFLVLGTFSLFWIGIFPSSLLTGMISLVQSFRNLP